MVKYEHIFGDPTEQLGAAKVFQLVLKVRDRLLDVNRVNRRPAIVVDQQADIANICNVSWKYTHTR